MLTTLVNAQHHLPQGRRPRHQVGSPHNQSSVSKLVENKTIVELILTIEPGPKVDCDGLRTNLALLQPYVIKTSSGPALLGFFKSLLQLQAGWLLGAAKLEAFRCYDRTLFTYYVEWYEEFRKDTAARALDELEIVYEKECQGYAVARAGGSYAQREQQLVKEVDNEAIKLATCKTSPEMWKYSRILWTIVEQYQHYTDKECACPAEESSRRRGEEEEGRGDTAEEGGGQEEECGDSKAADGHATAGHEQPVYTAGLDGGLCSWIRLEKASNHWQGSLFRAHTFAVVHQPLLSGSS